MSCSDPEWQPFPYCLLSEQVTRLSWEQPPRTQRWAELRKGSPSCCHVPERRALRSPENRRAVRPPSCHAALARVWNSKQESSASNEERERQWEPSACTHTLRLESHEKLQSTKRKNCMPRLPIKTTWARWGSHHLTLDLVWASDSKIAGVRTAS